MLTTILRVQKVFEVKKKSLFADSTVKQGLFLISIKANHKDK